MIIRLLIGVLLLPSAISAATYPAADCTESAVATAIGLASGGDIVTIPGSCSESWSSAVTVNKAITIQGQTTTSRNESTYAVTATDSTTLTGAGFDITVDDVRITGITFTGSGYYVAFPADMSDGVRIDHSHFTNGTKLFNQKANSQAGLLFDNNLFENPSTESWYILGDGNEAFADDYVDANASPATTTFIEDNEFKWNTGGGTQIIDAGDGARVVFRYNLFNGNESYGPELTAESHGHCEGQKDTNDNAGAQFFEFSNNKLNSVKTDAYAVIMKSRGGRLILYDNNLLGSEWLGASQISLWIQEAGTQCNDPNPCAVQVHEDLSIHDVPLSGDANYTAGLCDAYPCPMQTQDTYMWGNTKETGTITVTVTGGAEPETFIEEDRDYFDDMGVSDTNFISGIASALPGTCTIDDSYFATDTEILYNCTTTNNWETVYTGYTYPHPLQDEEPEPPIVFSWGSIPPLQ